MSTQKIIRAQRTSLLVLLVALWSWGCPDAPAPLDPVERKSCPDFARGLASIGLSEQSPASSGPLGTAVVKSADIIGVDWHRKFLITHPVCADEGAPEGYVFPEGRWPVIVFSHAQNDRRHQIYDAYDALHRHWASWGYIVLSVDNAEENRMKVAGEQTGTENIQARSDLQRAGIDLLEVLDGIEYGLLEGRIDLDKVVVAGHSRGGGASLLSAGDDARVAALVLFQSIDPGAYGHGSVYVDVPAIGISAGLDDDVKFPRMEAIEDLFRGPYGWVDILGGIHAYTTDDIPERRNDLPEISRDEQQTLSHLFSTLFLLTEVPPRAFAFEGGLASELFYSHRGAEIAHDLVEPSVRTRWNTRSDKTILIDAFEFESVDESFLESVGLRGDGYRFDGEGFASFAHTYGAYATRASHFLNRSRALRLSSPGPLPGRLVIELGEPMTLSCRSSLSARVRVLDPRLLSADGVSLAAGMSDDKGEERVELAAMIGPGGFGRTYTQLDVPMSALGCEGEGLRVEAFFVELNNIDVMIDDLRIVER